MSKTQKSKRSIEDIIIYITFISFIILFPITIYHIHYTPLEAIMGVVQKIFYFHMPSAIYTMVMFFISFIFSIAFLIKPKDSFDNIASTATEIGVLLATYVIISGPLWAKKAWGAYWVWDARLTFTLIMWMIYVSYLIIRSSNLTDKVKKISAAISILGFVDVPLVHYSVKKWGGAHPIVTQGKKFTDTLAPEMITSLYLSFATMAVMIALLFLVRYKLKRLESKLNQIEYKFFMES